ncbi:MAG TPA: helix-turn-helix domain-containing protein [Microbacteriaceae bacterium]
MSTKATSAQNTPHWGTIADAAQYYSVSTRTIRRMIAAGDLEARRVGKKLVRINLAALAEAGRPLGFHGDANV